jgi:hypothetical protein
MLLLPGCTRSPKGISVAPIYGSRISANPGETLKLWAPGDQLMGSFSMISEGKTVSLLPYLKSAGEFEIPISTPSRVYMIDGQRPIIIKDPKKQAPIVVVFPSNTKAAYNFFGGGSLYYGRGQSSKLRARQVSYVRPYDGSETYSLSFLDWHGSLPSAHQSLFRFICDQDMDDFTEIENAKVVVLIGHSEYWTRTARTNFDKFVDSGGNAAILSGNTMWWQVRYSTDGSSLICYKSASEDPIGDPTLATINWFDPSLNYPIIQSTGANFANGGYGLQRDSGWDGYRIVSPNSPLLVGTGLKQGQILDLPTHEYDGAPITGFDSRGFPILDDVALGFQRTELIGFDFGVLGGKKTVATFFAFQKSANSGIIVNTASTNWCSADGIGAPNLSGFRIRKITENIIFGLLNGKPIFSR